MRLDGRSSAEQALERLAAAQHGVLSRAQATAAGLTPERVRRQVDSGRWHRVAPSVYGFPGHADTWLRRLWIAHLHAGPESVISHRSAIRLDALGPIQGWPVDLIVPRGSGRAVAGARVFRVTDLGPEHVRWMAGLPVTVPARSIVDAASVLSRRRLSAVIEAAEVDRRCRLVDVATMLDALRRPGKPGVRRLCEVLDELGPGQALARSELEKLLDGVIDLAGLPEPLREHPLPGSGGPSGFVDRCWPEASLIAEADGRKWHTRRSQIALDHDRDLQAARAGHLTLRFIWERLTGDPTGTAAALSDVYHQRRSG